MTSFLHVLHQASLTLGATSFLGVPWSLWLAMTIAFSVALGVALWVVPWVRTWALKKAWLDAPGERKIHTAPMCRLGGVGIYAGFMVAAWLSLSVLSWIEPVWLKVQANTPAASLWGLGLGGLLMFVVGVVDDLKNLPAWVKLIGQIVAVLVAIAGGVCIHSLDLPGSWVLLLQGFSVPVTMVWLVGLTNAVNFIDGVDGLASGVGMISTLALVVVALFTGQPVVAVLAVCLMGAILGFWVYNAHPAKLFMGDSGALFIGSMLAMLSVTGIFKTPIVVMLLPILILIVPIVDITWATLRRLLKGQSPFVADADHLHHRLLRAGLSQQKTVWVFYGVHFLTGLMTACYLGKKYIVLYLILSLSLTMAGWLGFKTLRQQDTLPV
ncbi:MAG: glycosyltransferase family 4 protein [Vampirovibrionales bacterium]